MNSKASPTANFLSLYGTPQLPYDEMFHYMMILCHYMMILCHYMMILCYYMMILCHYMMKLCYYMMILCYYMMIFCYYMMTLCYNMMVLCHYMMVLCHYMMILYYMMILCHYMMLLYNRYFINRKLVSFLCHLNLMAFKNFKIFHKNPRYPGSPHRSNWWIVEALEMLFGVISRNCK